MENLHPYYDLPQKMMGYKDGTSDWVYNHKVKEGDEIIESWVKNPETQQMEAVTIKIVKVIDQGVSKGDFSNWSRPPFWFRGIVA
jgi:hypothetical protein